MSSISAAVGSQRSVYLVLGMHRSGTSAIARVLASMGMRLPQGLMPADDYNARGYFESSSISALNSARLNASRSAWDDAFIACRTLTPASEAQWLKQAKFHFQKEYGGAKAGILKDPRMSVVLPAWRPVFDELDMQPRCIVAVRHPLAVAASLAKRNGFTAEKSVLLWCAYMLAAAENSQALPRVFVGYDSLLADWRWQAARIRLALDVPADAPSEAAQNAIDAFLTTELRHHAAVGDLAPLGWIGDLAETIYVWCKAGADGAQPPSDGLQAAAEIFEARRQELAPLVSPPSHELDVARMNLVRLSNLLAQQPTRERQDR